MNYKFFSLFFLSILLIGIVSATLPAYLQPKLVSCWNLEESSGTVIDNGLGQQNNGTNNGGTVGVPSQTTSMGNAYNFNPTNTQNISIPDSSSLNLTGDFTYAVIFNTTAENIPLVGKGFWSSNAGFGFVLTGGGFLYTNIEQASGGTMLFSGVPKVNTGNDVMGIVTYRAGTNAEIYINGTSSVISTTGKEASAKAGAGNLFIGGMRGAAWINNTYISEVWVINGSINATDASLLWNSGTMLSCTVITSPSITLVNPIDGQNFNVASTVFSTLPRDPDNLTGLNVSIYGNFTGSWSLNISNSSSYDNTQTNFTISIPDGVYKWGALVSDGLTSSWSNNRTFSISHTTTNSINWNVTTAESANESFIANITSNGSSITSAWLNYNGTTYQASIVNTVGNFWNLSKYFDVPLGYTGQNRTFNFTFTMGGTNYSTINNTQNVSLLYFSFCNGTYTDNFLNISFQDEVSGLYINASLPSTSWTYYLGSGLVNKTLSYPNATNNYYYEFCSVPSTNKIKVLPNVQYKQGTAYPQKIWQPTLQNYNSSVFSQILTLLSSSDGIFVTYQVTNLAGETINGVDVNVTRTSDGTLISSGVTDAAGLVTFFLNPDIQQTIGFSKTGYTTHITSMFPTQSSYTITMGSPSTTTDNYAQGIRKSATPTNGFLDENTSYNFSYTISSSYWTLDSFTFSLYYGNNTLIGTNTSTANGGTLYLFNISTTNQSYIYMNYSYVINGNYTNSTRNWVIHSTTGRGYSIWNIFVDLGNFIDSGNGLFGIDNFGKLVISLAIIIFSVGLINQRYGVNSEAGIMVILFSLVFLLDYGLNFIPTLQIGNLDIPDNFVSVLAFILVLVTIFREEQR